MSSEQDPTNKKPRGPGESTNEGMQNEAANEPTLLSSTSHGSSKKPIFDRNDIEHSSEKHDSSTAGTYGGDSESGFMVGGSSTFRSPSSSVFGGPHVADAGDRGKPPSEGVSRDILKGVSTDIFQGVSRDTSLLTFLLTDDLKSRYDIYLRGDVRRTTDNLLNFIQSVFEKEVVPAENRWKSDKKKLESRVKELEGLLGESGRKNERFEKQVALLEAKLEHIHEVSREKTDELDEEVGALTLDETKEIDTRS